MRLEHAMGEPWTIADDLRVLHRQWTRVFGVLALLAWLVALWGTSKAPWVADLYHLINPGVPRRGESTAVYLFVFPVMLTGMYLLNRLAPNFMLERAPRSHVGFSLGMLVAGLGAFGFLIATIVRAATAAALAGS